jgi:hypothetical protein
MLLLARDILIGAPGCLNEDARAYARAAPIPAELRSRRIRHAARTAAALSELLAAPAERRAVARAILLTS